MNYKKVYQYLINFLEKNLPNDLPYHGVHHTIDVVNTTKKIAIHEKLNEEDTILCLTAALFHDSGFVFRYENNEFEAIKLCREILPDFKYNKSQINKIAQIIEATIIHVKPRNLFEQIMVDADFDYFGRDDFFPIATTLFEELKLHGYHYTTEEWNKIQVNFLKKHRYYTSFAIKYRLPKKMKNVSLLEQR